MKRIHSITPMNSCPVFFRIYRNRKNAASAPSMRPKALSGSIAKYSRGLALSALALIGASQAPGATLTWDATAGGAINDGGGAWLTAGLWNDGSPSQNWVSGSDAIFGNAGVGGAVTLASPTTVNTLTFNSFTGTYTLGTVGQAITLTAGITINSTAGAVTISSPIILGGSQNWTNNSSSSLTISSTVGGTGSPTLTNNGSGSGSVAVNGGLQSTVGKIVQNSATSNLNLRGDNTAFTGTIEILKGTLFTGASQNSFGTTAGQVTLGASSGSDAATLELGNNSNNNYNAKPIVLGTTAGTLKIRLKDDGGTNTHTINGAISGANNLTLESAFGNDILAFSTGGINNTGTITHIGAGSGDLNINSVIGSNVTGVIQNSATSRMVIGAANTFSGTTTVTAGTLHLTNNLALQNSALDTTGSGVVTFSVTTPTIGGLNGSVNLATKFTSGYTGIVTTLTLNPVSGVTATYSGAIANGTMALTKTGAGTQILSGANSYTGTTTINRGTLTLNRNTGSLSSSTALTFGGTGTFNMDNTGAGGALAQSLGALTFSAGEGTVQITRTANQDQTLTFSSLGARAAGATGNFVHTGGTNSATNGFTLTGVTADAPMGPGYFFNGGTTTANYAFYNAATSFVRGINWGVDATTSTAAGGAITGIAYAQSTGSTTATINAQVFTGLNFQNTTATAQAVNITGAITTDGILRSGNGAGTTTISGGTSIATTTAGADLVIRTDMANDALTITTPILVNGASGLTKSGAGTLVLGGTNTYTGTTFVNAGTLSISANANLGSGGTLNLNGATLRSTASPLLTARPIAISNGATITTDAGTTLTHETGAAAASYLISGTGGLTKTGDGTLLLRWGIGGAADTGTFAPHTFTGGVVVNGGTLRTSIARTALVNSVANFINSGNSLTLSRGTYSQNMAGGNFTLTQTFNGLTVNGGANFISLNIEAGTSDNDLSIGAIARSASLGGTITFSALDAKNSIGNTTGNTNVNGILGQWAFWESSTGTKYATNTGATTASTPGSQFVLGGLTGTSAGDANTFTSATANYDFTTTGTTTLSTNRTANTVRYSTNSGKTIDTNGNTLTLNGLLNSGIGALTISGTGSVVIGTTNQLVVHPSDSLTANSPIVISTPITGSAGATLVKAGPGNLTLSGANTYDGGTFLNAGTLTLGSTTALGTGTLTIIAGSLDSSVASLVNANTNAQNWNTDITFVGTNSLNLGTGAVTMNASRTVGVNANTLTVGGAIGGSGFGLTKTGNGTLVLSGANTYDGATIINAGTLQVGNATAGSLNGTTGTALTFGGTGSFIVSEASGVSQGMGILTFNTGSGNVTSTNNGGNSFLTFASLTARATGATGNFITSGGTPGTTNKIVLTSTTNAPLGGSGPNNQGFFFGGTEYARYDAGGYFRATDYSGVTDTNASSVAGGATIGSVTSSNDVKITGAITTQTAVAVNTINMGAFNITMTGASPILQANGLLASGGTNITLGGGTTPRLQPTSSGGEIVIRIDGSSDQLTVSSIIQNNTTASTLTKTGAGTLVLSGTNTYTGQTYVNGGTLSISSNANLGDQTTGATLNLNNGATLRTTATFTLGNGAIQTNARQMVIGGGVTINTDTGTTLTTGGVISGTGGLTKTGAGTFVLGTISNVALGFQNFTGGLTVNGGSLVINISQSFGNTTDGYIPTSNVLTLGGASFTVNGAQTRGHNQTFSGLVLSSGDNAVVATNGGGSVPSMNLNLNGITRSGFSTINASTSAPTGTTSIRTTTANINLILGPWATFGTGTSTRYATGATTTGTSATITGLTGTSAEADAFTSALANYEFVATGTTTLTDNRTANTARYSTGTGNTIDTNGNTLTLNGLLNAGAGTVTVSGSGSVVIGSTNELVVNAANAGITISAPITGGNGTALIKTGTGTLTLSADNTATYTGGTYLNNGTLTLGSTTALGTGTLTISGGSLRSAVANLVNANNNVQTWNGDFTFVGANSLDLGTGAVTLTGNRTVAVTANTLTVGGAIGDSGSGFGITKIGAGTVALSGSNTYTGATAVTEGTLVATIASALGTTAGSTQVASTATLDVQANIGLEGISVGGTGVGGNGALIASTGTGTVGGAVTLAASTSIGGAGTLNVNGSVAAGAFTLTTVGAGTTNFGTASTLTSVGTLTASAVTTNVNSALGSGSSAVSVSGGSTLKFGSVSQTLSSLTIGAGSTVTFTSGLASFSGGGGKGASFSPTSTVPEPGTLGLLLVGALGVLNRRRRQA